MLKSEEYDDYTIVSLGLEAGFNSKSTFYNAFKRKFDVSPSEFRKNRGVDIAR
jgi:AraC-like DNA-binding protein